MPKSNVSLREHCLIKSPDLVDVQEEKEGVSGACLGGMELDGVVNGTLALVLSSVHTGTCLQPAGLVRDSAADTLLRRLHRLAHGTLSFQTKNEVFVYSARWEPLQTKKH